MRIVLVKDVPKLGQRGDIKNVKSGYFRNCLFPRSLALVATPVRLKAAEERDKKRTIEKERLVKEAKEVIKKFKGLVLEFVKKTSSKGKLYAAIQEKDIIAAVLKELNIKLEPQNVSMVHIKEEGEHKVLIVLVEGVEAEIKVLVKKQ